MDQHPRSAFTLRMRPFMEPHQLPTYFNCSSGSRWLILSWFFFSELDLLPSLSLLCFCPLLLLFLAHFLSPTVPRCPGYEGSQNVGHPGSQTDPTWSSIPRLLPPCYPPPLRPPRPPPWHSRLKFPLLSHPLLRPLPTEWRGWTAQGPHWTTTQDL
jgi:hypothetical protein